MVFTFQEVDTIYNISITNIVIIILYLQYIYSHD